jgi:hypothetical protein
MYGVKIKKDLSPSIYGLEYLEKIVNLCVANGVEVVFVRSPQHLLCSHRQNEDVLQQIKRKIFSDIEFLDFNDFALNDNEFGDFEHVNFIGAKTFSSWFEIHVIKKHLK